MKRFFSLLMSVVMLVCTLSVNCIIAPASQRYSYDTVNDTVVYSYSPEYSYTLNIYGGTKCSNTNYYLEYIKKVDLAGAGNIKINFIDVNQASKKEIENFAKKISYGDVSFCYYEKNDENCPWFDSEALRKEYGGTYTNVFPYAIVCDNKGKVISSTTGYQGEANIKALFNGLLKTDLDAKMTQYSLAMNSVQYCQTMARTMLDMVNNFRTGGNAWYWNSENTQKVYETSLQPLVYDYELESTAMLRAAEIAYSYDHIRPNNKLYSTAYIGEWHYCAENIAYGQTSATEVFNDWLEEGFEYMYQGHRRNMLSSSVKAVAFGCVYYNGTYYWTQEFRDLPSTTPATVANNSVQTAYIDVNGVKRHIYDNIFVSKAPTCTAKGEKSFVCSDCGFTRKEAIKPLGHKYDKNSKCVRCGAIKNDKTNTSTSKKVTIIVPSNVKVSALKKGFKVSWKKISNVSGYQIQYSTDSKFKKNKKTITISKKSTTSKKVTKLKGGKKYYVRVRSYKKVNNKKYYSTWTKAKKITTKK